MERFGWIATLIWIFVFPVIPAVLRFVGNTGGWLTFIYLLYGVPVVFVALLIFAFVAGAVAKTWQERAVAVEAFVSLMVMSGLLCLAALSINDFGDSGPAAISPMEKLLGPNIASWIGLLSLLAALIAWIVACVLAITGARRAKAAHSAQRAGYPPQ